MEEMGARPKQQGARNPITRTRHELGLGAT